MRVLRKIKEHTDIIFGNNQLLTTKTGQNEKRTLGSKKTYVRVCSPKETQVD